MRRWSRLVLFAGVGVVCGLLLGLDQLADAKFVHSVALMGLAATAMFVVLLYRPERRIPFLCDPFVLTNVFLAQFFILGPIVVMIWGFTPTLFFTPPQPEAIAATMLAFLVMILAFILGSYVRLGVLLAELLPGFEPARRRLPAWWFETTVLMTGVVGSIAWVQHQGGLLATLRTPYGARKTPPLFALCMVALLLATFLLAWRVIRAPRPRKREFVSLSALLLFDAVFYGVLFGVRKYLLFLFFGITTMWLLRRGARTLPKVRAAVLLAGILVFFSVWGAVRHKPVTAMLGLTEGIRYSQTGRGLHMGYVTAIEGPFSGACKVMEVFPAYEPFRRGRTLAIALLGFIPRAVWPDKPIGIGKEVTRYYEGPFYDPRGGLSVAPTVLGEFWVNFGWLGVIGSGFLLGLVCRTASAYAVSGMRGGLQTRAARVLIPAAVVAGLGEVRADAAALILTWGLLLVPLVVGLALFDFDAER